MNRIKLFFLNNYWFITGIFLSLVLIFLWFSSIGEIQFLVLFSSDALYLPSIYKDIFVDENSIQGWTFNPAPNFIPDMLLFFILMVFTSNFLTATFLFSIIQYFTIIALFYTIFRKISNINATTFSLSIYLFSFFLLYFLVDNDFYYSFLIMSNSYHNGMFVMVLVSILLSLHFFKTESWITLLILFVLTTLSFPCDKLFFIAYTCPIALITTVLLILGYNKRKILKMVICCVLSYLLGMVILDKFLFNPIFHLSKPHQYITLEAIISSWKVFSSQMKLYMSEFSFKNLTISLSIIAYIWGIYYCIAEYIVVKRNKKEISLFFIFQIFVLFFTPILLFAPIINGNYEEYSVIRYNYFIFIVLLFDFILLIHHYIKQQKYFTVGFNCFFAMMLTGYLLWNIFNTDFGGQLKNYFSFYPKYARNLDKQFPTNNITIYGITDDYWYAKHATMFSKKNIRLYDTFDNAVPWLHVSNENWYFGGGNGKYSNPKFTFLLWDSNKKLPDFFIEQNSPYQSDLVDESKTLYFVKPFIFIRETMQPQLLNQYEKNE